MTTNGSYTFLLDPARWQSNKKWEAGEGRKGMKDWDGGEGEEGLGWRGRGGRTSMEGKGRETERVSEEGEREETIVKGDGVYGREGGQERGKRGKEEWE